jgi:hypothetical protein
MRLGSFGRVKESNRSDLDSHADCFVGGEEVLIFNDFDWEVTVTGWDPEGGFDIPSEHFQPYFEPQLVEHHAHDIA